MRILVQYFKSAPAAAYINAHVDILKMNLLLAKMPLLRPIVEYGMCA